MNFEDNKTTFEDKNNVKEEIECRNCGGIIPKENMDFNSDVATCPFCGTTCRIHDSITKHYTNTYININRGDAGNSNELSKTVYINGQEAIVPTKKGYIFVLIFVGIICGTIAFSFISVSKIFDRTMDEYEKSLTSTTTTVPIKVTDVNPFDPDAEEHITVDFYGLNGQGYLTIYMPSKYNKLTYTLDKSSNLSNGDTVTITLTNTEAYPEYNFTKITGTATVNGLGIVMQ